MIPEKRTSCQFFQLPPFGLVLHKKTCGPVESALPQTSGVYLLEGGSLGTSTVRGLVGRRLRALASFRLFGVAEQPELEIVGEALDGWKQFRKPKDCDQP